MKNILLSISVIVILGLGSSCNSDTKNADTKAALHDGEKVAVIYFHFTHRCATCNAVENVSRSAIADLYGDKVSFKSYNLDEEEGQKMGNNLKASGQTLLIITPDTRIDLTNEGFMYALEEPDKLKKAIKEKVDPLL